MKRAYLIIVALVLLIIGFQIARPSFINRVRPRIIDFLEFPLKTFTEVTKGLYNLASFQNAYEKKISFLEKRVAALTKDAVAIREILEENKRLRSLLSFKSKFSSNNIAAEVIGRDLSNWDAFLIIDKGEADGIKPNMSVAKYEGLIGSVFEVGKNTSKVMLIDNPNSKIGAVIQRTREQGVLVGLGGGRCKIIYLSSDSDVKAGDIVVASNSETSSLKGILIGEVIEVLKEPNSLYKSAFVSPYCNLFKIEEVLCIE